MVYFVFLTKYEGLSGLSERARRASVFIQDLASDPNKDVFIFLLDPSCSQSLETVEKLQSEFLHNNVRFLQTHWSQSEIMPVEVQRGHQVLNILHSNSFEQAIVEDSILIPATDIFDQVRSQHVVCLKLGEYEEEIEKFRHVKMSRDTYLESVNLLSPPLFPVIFWNGKLSTVSTRSGKELIVVDGDCDASIRLVKQFLLEDSQVSDAVFVCANQGEERKIAGHWNCVATLEDFEIHIERNSIGNILFLSDSFNLQSFSHVAAEKGCRVCFAASNWISRENSYSFNCNGLRSFLGLPNRPPRVEIIKDTPSSPVVTVCLTHKDRPHLLSQALESLQRQTLKNFEVVLIDDGSVSDVAKTYLQSLKNPGWAFSLKVIHTSNIYLGAARNLAVQHATASTILFMDDDNIALPRELEVLMDSFPLLPPSTILTIPCYLFEGDSVPDPKTLPAWRFGIDNIEYSKIVNFIGDANFAISKDLFWQLGGFSDDYGVGHEDWEFLVKASLAGVSVMSLTEVLYCYRRSEGGMLRSASHQTLRHLRPILQSHIKNGDYLRALQEIAMFRMLN